MNNTSLRCLTIDDELPALNLINAMVKKTPFLSLTDSTINAFEAVSILEKHPIDLLFLDIEMPDISGVDFLRSLDVKPMVIFTTAYDHYAVEGFSLDAVDYLLKPIAYERFLKASEKALELYQLRNASSNVQGSIQVRVNYETKKILLDDILYIEGVKDYVKIVTKEGNWLTRQNLKGISALLPQSDFVRIHRSFIVSWNKVSGWQKKYISIGDKKLPVGDKYREMFIDKLP